MRLGISAHPLVWPDIIPRSARRESGQFKTTLAAALNNVEDSLRKFGRDSGKPVKEIVLSSNYALGVSRPADPGVAAWFVWEDTQLCIPVDRYATIEANLQAIHHIIEARRVELRHGTLHLVRATFRGFRALPDPNRKTWREVLKMREINAPTADAVNAQYRQLASKAHPDKGGSAEAMSELNRAREQALQEIGP